MLKFDRAVCLLAASVLCATPPMHAQSIGGAKPLKTRPDLAPALNYLQSGKSRVIEDNIAIAQVPSSPFAEQKRAEYMADRFRAAHLTSVTIDPKGNVLGFYPGATDDLIVLAAHLDTVFPPGTDFTVRRDGDKLYGPGTADDSEGLASLLALAGALHAGEIKTEHTLLFVADVGEEGLGNLRGIHYLFEQGAYRDRIRAFFSIDGSGTCDVWDKEIGSRRYRVTITGPGGHSSDNFGRVNPANALGNVIAQIAQYRVPTDPRTTYNVGRIGGGTSVNSIPGEVWFEMDMRSQSEDELNKLDQRFVATVSTGVDQENAARESSQSHLTVKLDQIGLRHAVSLPQSQHLVQAMREACAEYGKDVRTFWGSTDSNVPASRGIPSVSIGAGAISENEHSLNEWEDLSGVAQGLQVDLLTVLRLDEK